MFQARVSRLLAAGLLYWASRWLSTGGPPQLWLPGSQASGWVAGPTTWWLPRRLLAGDLIHSGGFEVTWSASDNFMALDLRHQMTEDAVHAVDIRSS